MDVNPCYGMELDNLEALFFPLKLLNPCFIRMEFDCLKIRGRKTWIVVFPINHTERIHVNLLNIPMEFELIVLRYMWMLNKRII